MSSSETQTAANRFRFLAEAAAWRYRAQGFAASRSVRNTLLRDPFYRELLAASRLPAEGLILDLGCGRGVLLALLACALPQGMAGGGQPGAKLRLMGVEQHPKLAESARLALAGKAEIITGDLCSESLPPCRAAILLDVLFYLEPAQQDRLLERLVAVLEEDGLLILREPDTSDFMCRAGMALWASALRLSRRERGKRFYPRRGEEWKTRLEALGLVVESLPTDGGSGFANVLLTAQKSRRIPPQTDQSDSTSPRAPL